MLLADFQGLFDVLAKAVEGDDAGVGTYAYTAAAGKCIHLGGVFLTGEAFGAKIAPVVGCNVKDGIVIRALVVAEVEEGDIVLLVLLVKEFEAVELGNCHILVPVNEDGLDGSGLGCGDFLEECALLVTVGEDRGNLGGVDFLDVLVFAETLVDDRIVVSAKEFVGPGHYIVLSDLLYAGDLGGLVFPGSFVDEGVHEVAGAAAVALQGTHVLKFPVGLGGFNQFLREISGAELGNLCKDDVAYLFKALAFLRHAFGGEEAPVRTVVSEECSAKHLLGADAVQVHKTGLAVVEDIAHDVRNLALCEVGAGSPPAKHKELSLKAVDVLFLDGGEGRSFRIGTFGKVGVGFPLAEVLLDDFHHLLGVEVTGEADGYVVGNIIGVLLVADGLQGRVLEVVLGADNGLGAVRVLRVEHLVYGVEGLLRVRDHGGVLLLINCLELRVETTEDAVHEAVGLYLCPVLYLVGGDFLNVAGDVVGCVGVGALGADDGHQLVVLVGDCNLGGLVADGVDFLVEGFALCGVSEGAVYLEERVYLLQEGLFSLVVLGAETLGALEHHVLQVVGKTGVVCGIVLTAGVHCYACLDAGFVLVYGHVNL